MVWGKLEKIGSNSDSDSSSGWKKSATEKLSGVEWQSLSDSSAAPPGQNQNCDAQQASEEGEPDASPEAKLIASKGSVKHGAGRCVPCHYLYTKRGCARGSACTFCHLHTKTEQARPCRAARAKAKSKAAQLDALSMPEAMEQAMKLQGQGHPYMQAVIKSKLKKMAARESPGDGEDDASAAGKRIVAL